MGYLSAGTAICSASYIETPDAEVNNPLTAKEIYLRTDSI